MPWAQSRRLMPTVVFPDTPEGRREWERWEKSERTRPQFCNHWRDVDKQSSRRVCATRERNAHDHLNWCMRCPAGYLFDPDAFLSSGTPQSLTGSDSQ